MPGEILTATRRNFYVDGHARVVQGSPALGDMVQEEHRENTNEWMRRSLGKRWEKKKSEYEIALEKGRVSKREDYEIKIADDEDDPKPMPPAPRSSR